MVKINFFAVFIFLGLFQGLFLAVFFLFSRKASRNLANIIMGIFIMILTLLVLRSFILYSGIKIPGSSFLNLFPLLDYLLGPVYYFYIYSWIYARMPRFFYLHLAPALLILVYLLIFFISPPPPLMTDPLELDKYHPFLCFIHMYIYSILHFMVVYLYCKSRGQSHWKKNFKENRFLWIMSIIFAAMVTTTILIRLLLPQKTGDIAIISYLTLFFYILTYWMLKGSQSLRPRSNELWEEEKYKKSSLNPQLKEKILKNILAVMEQKPYLEVTFTLGKLSEMVGATSHHVSQVLNECQKTTFPNMVARYRIDEARRLLTTPKESERTILDIAESVGYSSKSAFNTAFKKITSMPPSQYRKKYQIKKSPGI